jgi:hypothetical protein
MSETRAALGISSEGGIRLYELVLRGPSRDYRVSFKDNGTFRALSIVSGEISTGKTTVLEFIDFCLGNDEHPSHPEVLKRVTSALLEISLAGVRYVIERSIGVGSGTAAVYVGGIENVPHSVPERLKIRPPGDSESLSSFLLASCGLDGIELREAPTKEESATDPLSIRDVMWLCHMPNERIDSKNLLKESHYMQEIKLRQVVDVIFGVHDDEAALLARRLDALRTNLRHAEAERDAVAKFVNERSPRPALDLESERVRLERQLREMDSALVALDAQAHQATSFADAQRERHETAAQVVRQAGGRHRDKETLLRRLLPLRAQYAEDIRKLRFLSEAHILFDPVAITVCPACLGRLATSPTVVDDACTLCRAHVPRADLLESDSFAIDSEIRSVERRLRELDSYVDETERDIEIIRAESEEALLEETRAANSLNEATRVTVSPFLAERDSLARERGHLALLQRGVEEELSLYLGVSKREDRIRLLQASISTLRDQLKETTEQRDRREVISRISVRFGEILLEIEYPKLEMPFVDDRLVPHVRGLGYASASSGARTLLALAWMLATFEYAFESGSHHPGFVMIDSPQKNLGPGSSEQEFQDARLVENAYRHIIRWLAGPGQGAQVLIVDNAPPLIANNDVVVRFTRDPNNPPYGLIDDEVD